MPMHTTRLSRWVLVALAAAWIATGATAAPPDSAPVNADPQTVDTALANRADYWLKLLGDAKDAKDVLVARTGLMGDYARAVKSGQPARHAGKVAAGAQTLLTGGIKGADPLASLKAVNIAAAVATMPHLEVLPALRVMASHSSGGVRYFAWTGYSRIRGQVLTQGSEEVTAMLSVLAKADATETNADVAQVEYDAMNFTTNAPTGIDPALLKQASASALAIVSKTWPSRCTKIANGSDPWALACISAMSVLEGAAPRLDADRNARKQIRQMLVDVAWCAAFALDEASLDAQEAAAQGRDNDRITAEASQSAMTGLLMSTELALRRVTDVRRAPIATALATKDVKKLAPNVRIAVSEWGQLLKDDGVTVPNVGDFAKPKDRTPRSTSQPAPNGKPKRPPMPATP